MKTILILGGFGFIATNILKCIDEHYGSLYQVIVFDRIGFHPHKVTCKCIRKVYTGDFADEMVINRIFAENRIDYVIHALSSTVPATSGNEIFDIESNLVPTLKLLHVMTRHNVSDILYLSSGGAVYGDGNGDEHSENEDVFPKSSYGVVKLAIEKYLHCFAELYNIKPLILRISNPFGKYHYNEKQGIINIAVRKSLKDEPIQVWGTGEGRKDYIFVEDVSRIVLALMTEKRVMGAFNIASGCAKSVTEILDEIRQEGLDVKTVFVSAKLNDVQSFRLNTSKLASVLPGFRMTPFEEALRQTIAWEKMVITNSDTY